MGAQHYRFWEQHLWFCGAPWCSGRSQQPTLAPWKKTKGIINQIMLHNDTSSVYIQFGGWNSNLPRTSQSLVPYTWSLSKHSSHQRIMQLSGVKADCCSCWNLIITNRHSPVKGDNVAIVWHQWRETSCLRCSPSDYWLWSKNLFFPCWHRQAWGYLV